MARKIIPFEYYPKTDKNSPVKKSSKKSPLKIFGGNISFGGGKSVGQLSSDLDEMKSEFAGMDTSNLWEEYTNKYKDMENVYEDVTVPTEAYDLKRRQREQSLATGLSTMRESGLGAGSIQAIANASITGAAQDTAQISQDLYKNELLKAGEESRLQSLEMKGEDEAQKLRIQGAVDSRNLQFQVKQGLMSLTAGEIASIREADAYRQANKGGGGITIICTELHNQGYLNEDIYEADERFGNMVYENDPKLMFGYHLWAIYIVNFIKKYPLTAKYVYLLAKPWSEHMAYIMGDDSKKNVIGKIIHWAGVQFSYYIANRAIKRNKMFNVFKK
jgi:hypothetical protein